MSALGNRLETVLSLLTQNENNEVFADIGSDHAFLSIEVIKRNIAKKAIASDINVMPLEKGRENAELQNVDIEFVLSDGFDSLEDRGITSAAICGMGGELIAKMLLRSETAHRCELVLQPMTAQEDLRKALWENGFEILIERFAFDSGKPYTAMRVRYSGKNSEYSFNDLYLGKERADSPEFSKYCEKVRAAALKRRLGIVAQNGDTAQTDNLIEECQAHITSV